MADDDRNLAAVGKSSKESDSLFDDGNDDMDTDETETIEHVAKTNNANQLAARRRLEEYLEQKRLRQELEDDFDF